MTKKNLIYAVAWLVPLALLYCGNLLLSEPNGVSLQQLGWLATLLVTCIVILRWDRQFMRPSRWTWISLILSALVAVGAGLTDERLLTLALSLYLFAWTRSHFELGKNSEERKSHNMLSYLPALVVTVALPQAVMQYISDWQWSGLTNYAWAVVQHCELPFLVSSHSVEFPSVLWKRGVIFEDLFSAYTPLVISMIWLGWMQRPALLSPLYAMSVVGAAFLSNFLRFCFAVWLLSTAGVDCYQGWVFYATGCVALIATLFIFLATDRIIWVLLFPVVPADRTQQIANPLISIWNHYFSVLSNKPAGRPQE